MAAYETMF